MVASPSTSLADADYPLPWRTEETWTGRAIIAANNRRVVLIRKGRAGTNVGVEYMLATLIAGAMNLTYGGDA